MPLPRRRWLLAACLALVALTMAGWWHWPRPTIMGMVRAKCDTVTRGQYERVRLGMTDSEAAGAVGVLPNTFGDRPFKLLPSVNDQEFAGVNGFLGPDQHTSFMGWKGKDGSWLRVWLRAKPGEQQPTVVFKHWLGHTPDWQLTARAWLAWLRGLVGL